MPRTAIGLDIGTSAVRAAEVTLRGPASLVRFAQVGLAPGAVVDGEVTSPGAVSEAVEHLWKSAGLRTKRAAIAVANQKVVVREVPVPYMDEGELRGALRYQAQEYIPIPVEEAIFDYQVLEEFPGEEGARMMRILIVAAQRDMVNGFVDAVTAAGIEPVAVDLGPFAALRSVVEPMPPLLSTREAEVLVDIGGGVTSVVVHEEGTPRFVRIIPAGGSDITEALVAGLSVPADEAERLKAEIGLPPDGVVPTEGPMRIIDHHATRFVEDIRSSLEYYQAQEEAAPIARAVVIGAGARLPHLLDRMAPALHVTVEQGHPLAHLKVDRLGLSPEDLEQVEAVAGVAVGLALGERQE
jgi:type IV pilus assembly protein PilM